MGTSIVITDKFEAKIIENHIFHIFFFDKICLTVADIKISFDVYKLFSKGKKLKVIVEFGKLVTIDDDAREYAEANQIPAIAEALIMKSIANRVIAIMYFKFRLQKHPVKIHSSLEKGIEWLNSIN
jgi:hypothetical protein